MVAKRSSRSDDWLNRAGIGIKKGRLFAEYGKSKCSAQEYFKFGNDFPFHPHTPHYTPVGTAILAIPIF
jgi:hypothetical protein